jgi:hypothetical protein
LHNFANTNTGIQIISVEGELGQDRLADLADCVPMPGPPSRPQKKAKRAFELGQDRTDDLLRVREARLPLRYELTLVIGVAQMMYLIVEISISFEAEGPEVLQSVLCVCAYRRPFVRFQISDFRH